MSWDTVFLLAAALCLFQALLSLVIGRAFVRAGQQRHALDTLWYVILGVVFCLALALVASQMQIGELKRQLGEFQDQLEEFKDKL